MVAMRSVVLLVALGALALVATTATVAGGSEVDVLAPAGDGGALDAGEPLVQTVNETVDDGPVPAALPNGTMGRQEVADDLGDRASGSLETTPEPGDRGGGLGARVAPITGELGVDGPVEEAVETIEETGRAGPSSDEDEPEHQDSGGNGLDVMADLCTELQRLCEASAPAVPEPLADGLPRLGMPVDLEGPDPGHQAATDNEETAPQGMNPQHAVSQPVQDGALDQRIMAVAAVTAMVAVGAVWAVLSNASNALSAAWARWALLVKGGFLSLYARLSRSKVLDHETRQQIHAFLQAHPGACMSEIRAALATSESNTRHHLRVLESNGLVLPEKSGRRRCYFVAQEGLSARARTASAALASPAANRVYRAIRDRPGVRQKDLAAGLGISRTSVIFQVRRLQEAGVVSQEKRGREAVYFPVDERRNEPGTPLRDLRAARGAA